MSVINTWFSNALGREFESIRPLKESARGTVELIRHKGTGTQYILRRYSGNAEVYEKLLHYSAPNLPMIYEVIRGERENLVLEEYVQGDGLGELLRGGLFTPGETRKIAGQLCRALWVLHSMNAVHRDVKPENVILRGGGGHCGPDRF
ncbi:protein kinase domain-containing protein [Dysosmobacter welbionis]